MQSVGMGSLFFYADYRVKSNRQNVIVFEGGGLLTFNPISPILLSKQGDYSVVEKVKPDPLNLLANTNVGS